MFDAPELITLIEGIVLRVAKTQLAQLSPFRLGTIDPAYVSGNPKIVFDGEAAVSQKQYHYILAYTPAASDRVLLALVGASAVVLGKVST